MSRRTDKRLARVIGTMLDNSIALTEQADGCYTASINGKICARLSTREANRACRDDLLYVGEDHHVHVTKNARPWLSRQSLTKDGQEFAAQHRDMHTVTLIDSDGVFFQAQKNTAQSPLAWLRQHKGADKTPFLTATEFAAGERLISDYERSSLSQKLCANWDAPAHSSTPRGPRNAVLDAADNAIAAKDRFMNALAALGPGLDDLVFCLCIRQISLEAIEKSRKWPKRTGKIVVKLALDRLARHYGLV